MPNFILSLSCKDQIGIVYAIAGCLTEHKCNIVESAQFSDPNTGKFFMRQQFEADEGVTLEGITEAFQPIAEKFDMSLRVFDADSPPRVIIMVSKFDHCLRDLLYRVKVGSLNMNVVGIVSNHDDARSIAENNDIPFYHWPVRKGYKSEAEDKLLKLYAKEKADLVILARYMQVLSDDLCYRLSGKVINIHHSFLPSFKGAKPYHQAHERGVKLIGATAHYVTADLDEGPIIDQDVQRVTHKQNAKELVALGRDIESRVLARAVRLHVEHRLFLNQGKTVVFP